MSVVQLSEAACFFNRGTSPIILRPLLFFVWPARLGMEKLKDIRDDAPNVFGYCSPKNRRLLCFTFLPHNVEVTGASRLYRAVSGEPQDYALVAKAPRMVFGNPSTTGENSGLKR